MDLNIKGLAARLLKASKHKSGCGLCLGAGYKWHALGRYIVPVQCTCIGHKRNITIKARHIASAFSVGPQKDTGDFLQDKISYPLCDAIPPASYYEDVSSFVSKMEILREEKSKLVSMEVNEENVDHALNVLADRWITGKLSVFEHETIKELL